MSQTVPAFEPTAPLPDGTLLLEASAGTGKTYTITSLVLRLVAEQGLELERLLVVTFTRAAAAELRGRVRTRLTSAARELERRAAAAAGAPGAPGAAGATGASNGDDPDDEVVDHLAEGASSHEELARRARRLRAAAEGFDDATIDTIHGFCQRTLQRAAPDVDLELGAELTEDASELLDELVTDALVGELRDAHPDWYRFMLSSRLGVRRFRQVASALENEPDLRVLPDLDVAPSDGDDPAEQWIGILDTFRDAWQQQGEELAAWLESNSGDQEYRGRKLGKRVEALDDWCRRAIGDRDPKAIDTPLKWVCRGFLHDRFGADLLLPDHLDVVDAAEALRSGADRIATLALRRFADRVRDELPRRKRAKGVLTFTDQLVALDRALADESTREAVRAGIRTRFDVALIDEFQDTDPVQWRIFHQVFGGDGALRLIGDPKQAIYGFRGADVHTYLRAKNAVDDHAHRTLATNHRSDARYVAALDQLFGREEFEPEGVFAVPRIDHVSVDAAHSQDRLHFPDGQRAPLELVFVPRELHDPEGDPQALMPAPWARPFLARLTAQEIVDHLDSGATIGTDHPRPVLPSDIAVLVRTNDQAQRVQAALLDAGVPAVVGTDTSVFDTADAVAMQRLLDALLSPSDARALRAALTGPILGVDAQELVEQGTDEHLDRFDTWLGIWRRSGVAAMLRQVLADAGTVRRLVGQPRGERRLTNLRHLTELLHVAEASGRLGAEGVVAWLREQRHADAGSAEDRQLRLESDEDAVTVVTVHRSKGLQYGIVWCPFLWGSHLLMREEDRVLRFYDADADTLCLDLDADVKGSKARHVAIATRQRWEEELRLMYVALTRARHRCVVHTGAFKGSGSSPLYRLLHGGGAGVDTDGLPRLPDDPKDRSDDELRAELADLVSAEVALRDADPPRRDVVWHPTDSGEVALQVRSLERSLDRSWQRTSFSRLTSDADDHLDHDVGSPQDDGRDHDEVDGDDTVSGTEWVDGVEDVGGGGGTDGAPGVDEHGGVGEVGTAAGGGVSSVHGGEGEVPLATFPRGPEAGTFLHAVLEHTDFVDAAEPARIRQVIDEHAGRADLGGFGRAALTAAVQGILTTPLGAGPDDGDRAAELRFPADRSLSEVVRADRLDELDFDLPLSGGYGAAGDAVTLHRLAEVFADHAAECSAPLAEYAERLRRRSAPPARGFLTGSIDLILRVHEGDPRTARHLVIDHKSNWLGNADRTSTTLEHYHPARLAKEMVGHDYLLQYHLYLVAVHRTLRWRLGSSYDYDRHVAGVRYLFLRGMVGPDTPRTRDGGTYGVYADRPPRALVEDLDVVLAGVRS